MMNGLHSSCFDLNSTASNIHPFSQNDNISDNSQQGASAFYQNGVYCCNCKTGYVDFKNILKVEMYQYDISQNEISSKLEVSISSIGNVVSYNKILILLILKIVIKNLHRISFQTLLDMHQLNKSWPCTETRIHHYCHIFPPTFGQIIVEGQRVVPVAIISFLIRILNLQENYWIVVEVMETWRSPIEMLH